MRDGKTAYEHGARKLKSATGSDPNDAFSQEAAENRKPPLGMGLVDRGDEDLTPAKGNEPAEGAPSRLQTLRRS